MIDPTQVPDLDDGEPGTSAILTMEGWQAVPYEAPDPGWTLRDDGSWESADGRMRTFPLDAANGD